MDHGKLHQSLLHSQASQEDAISIVVFLIRMSNLLADKILMKTKKNKSNFVYENAKYEI